MIRDATENSIRIGLSSEVLQKIIDDSPLVNN